MPSNKRENIKRVIEKSNNFPVSLSKVFYAEYTFNDGNHLANYIEENHKINLDTKTASSFHELQQKYKTHHENAFISRKILETNANLVKGIVGIASVPARATGVGNIAVAGVNLFMDKILDYSLSEFDKSIKNSSEKILGYHLNKITEETGKSLEDITKMSYSEAHQFVFGSKMGIMDNSIESFQIEDKIRVVHEMGKILEMKMTQASALSKLTNESQDLKIEDVKQKLLFVTEVQAKHDECLSILTEDISNIEANLNSLSNCVEQLSEHVDMNTEDIGLLKDFVFSNADVKGKIQLLNSGLLDSSISEEEKQKLSKRLETLESKRKLQASIDSYLDKAKHITRILENTGVDPETVAKAKNLISVGNIAMSAFKAYSSGDVLGTVSAVSSLLGGSGGADPAAKRHTEIMNKLNLMDKKLDTIIENQQMILRNQLSILAKLDKLHLRINELHAIEMDRFDELETETLYNRLSNIAIANRPLANLETFSVPFSELKEQLTSSLNYDNLIDFYQERGRRLENNVQILDTLLNVYSTELDRSLNLKEYESFGLNVVTGVNSISELIDGFNSTVYYIMHYTNEKDKARLLSNTPMTDVYSLDSRLKIEKSLNHININARSVRHATQFLINCNLLQRIYKVLEEIHIFFPLQDKRTPSLRDLIPLNELLVLEGSEKEGRAQFKDLLQLVNIAIIQQNLLSGDGLLEYFYKRMFVDTLDINTAEYRHILEVLKKNKLLKSNFSKYFVKQQLMKTRTIVSLTEEITTKFEFFEYNVFLSDTSSIAQDVTQLSNLRMCFDKDLRAKIVFHDNRWKLNLHPDDADAYLLLPDMNEFKQGDLNYRRDLFELQSLKVNILDKVSEYNLHEFLDKNSPLTVNIKFN